MAKLKIENDEIISCNWFRPKTKNKTPKWVDSVEFSIDHRGHDKLSRNINDEEEFIQCFVHFPQGTITNPEIFLSVWGGNTNDEIDANILSDKEKELIISHAKELIKKEKEDYSYSIKVFQDDEISKEPIIWAVANSELIEVWKTLLKTYDGYNYQIEEDNRKVLLSGTYSQDDYEKVKNILQY